MTCKTCKHCRPIRGSLNHECGHEDVAGLVRCVQCGSWASADQYVLRVTAQRLACPLCGGLSPIPGKDDNELDDVSTRPVWCPGFERLPVIRQGNLF